MPKKAHAALARQADKKGLTGKARDRYIYGGLHALAERRRKKRKTQNRKRPRR